MERLDIKSIPAEKFEPISINDNLDREKISAPSLNFLQDSWRRLKKNKGAVISF
ncbi:ABC transporter permease, partial [Vagococcus fluvialis]